MDNKIQSFSNKLIEKTDVFGFHSLERMAEAPQFNYWMYETIAPYLNGKILEIGSGIGNLSAYFIQEGKDISLSDYNINYVALLEKRFGEKAHAIFQLDLSTPDFKSSHTALSAKYDSIFLLNVLEHIKDDKLAIHNCCFLLKPGGRLLILVPAYPFLFSKMDILLGHYRRYTISSLKRILNVKQLKTEKEFYFNCLGIAGWIWNKIFKKAEISQAKITLFNKLVPLGKLTDKLIFRSFGLSVIAIARKEN